MNKLLGLLGAVAALSASTAFANQNNVGTCGWGTKLFDGQSGVIPQVLAVTTNGTSGNQTFAISSGTSGCTQNGSVTTSWRTAMFIDSNMNRLAKDMAVGQGESMESLAALMGIEESDKALFYSEAKSNFASVFSNDEVTSADVMQSLNTVLANNAALAKYSA